MKNMNNTTELEKNLEIQTQTAIQFSDVVVYNEMADQTAVRLNLIEQIHAQLGQLETMIQRREFVMKEIFNHIAD